MLRLDIEIKQERYAIW